MKIYWQTSEGAQRQAEFVQRIQTLAAEGKTVDAIARELKTKREIVREILGLE